MVQQTAVTIVGYVGQEPRQVSADDTPPICRFRVASTRNYWNHKAQKWQESSTTWMDVRCYRELAGNVLTSVHVGDPVIVTGSLTTDQWEKDGQRHSATVLDAASIGHDLALGRSAFVRIKRSDNDPAHDAAADGLQDGDRGTPDPEQDHGIDDQDGSGNVSGKANVGPSEDTSGEFSVPDELEEVGTAV